MGVENLSKLPFILSLAYRNKIDEVCKPLANLGIKNFAMYIIFNDNNILILSNVFTLIKPYYQELLYQEDYTYTPELIQHDYYFCNEQQSLSKRLKNRCAEKYNYYPIYNIVRRRG